MPTKRTPIRRSSSPQITPQAVRLFEQLRRCRDVDRWRQLHSELCDELHTRPWQFPCIEDPSTQNPYPPGTPAHLSWQPDREAQERWKALAAASREARRQERAARKAAEQPPDQPTPPPAS